MFNNLEWVTAKENIEHLLINKGVSNQFSAFPKVASYDLNGKFLKAYDSPLKAAIDLGFKNSCGKHDSRGINDCAKGLRQSYKDKMFLYYVENYQTSIDAYIKKTRSGSKIEAIELTTKEVQVFSSIKEASDVLGIDKSFIYDVLKGEVKKAKNFSFKRL